MKTIKPNRRDVLKLASGLMTAATGGLTTSFANAAEGDAPPLRILTIVDSYGIPTSTRKDIWIDATAIDYALTDASLGTILQPLKAYKDSMLVMTGIDLDSKIQTSDAAIHGALATHTLGASRGISGTKDSSAKIPNASVDFAIADYLNEDARLPSKRLYPHLSISDYASRGATTYCFNKTGNQIRSMAGIQSAVGSIYGDTTLNTDHGAASTLVQSDLLDLVSGQVQSLKSQLDNDNYNLKLDAFNNSVEELADHLELKVAASCDVPAEITALNGSNGQEEIMQLIAQLFACDNATSVTYIMGGENINQLSHGFLDDEGDADVASLLKKNMHAASHRADDAANKVHEIIRIYQAQLIADLMDDLDSTIDVDGNTVLDNTVIFWTSAMSNNTHQFTDYPHLIMAGKNANLNGGYHYNCTGHSNNELLTTLAQGMGMPISQFGGFNQNKELVTSLNTGPIEKLLKTTLS